MSAVIDATAFARISGHLDRARHEGHSIVAGGT